MKPQLAAALPLALLVAGCVAPRRPVPVAAVPPVSRPQPVAPPSPAGPPGWRDAPLTPGNWRYEPAARRSSFAGGLFAVRCDPAARTVTLARQDGGASLTVSTSATARTLAAAGGSTALAARDPLLDQIAFSRGRFAVETPGQPRLVIPAWPEFARVVEDCRG